ncbi:MAG: hypothetical protein JSU65_12720 [Candidatus Zixiibacteriota bacterium]|nr:MAG: hypothetical protein JSU65_12720 [candidate division Zixibacteria bacterium]
MDRFSAKIFRTGTSFLPAGIIVLATLMPIQAQAQDTFSEEIVIGFEVPRLVKKDIFVQYDGNTVYLPVIEVLSVLELNVKANLVDNTISGFILDEKDKFHFDLDTYRVTTSDGEYHLLPSEYFLGATDLFLRVDLYEQLFGLKAIFDFSLLQVTMPFSEDFPAYQRMKRQTRRRKLQEKKEELKDVRELPQSREYINGAVMDWVLGTNPLDRDGQYYNVQLGGMLLGGDTYLSAAGRTRETFDKDEFAYRWHYFVDRTPYITQVELGRVYSSGGLGRQFTGVAITNKPQVRRTYFQTVQLEGYIGENWEVELWVDNRLTDYVTTDSRGEYSFMLDYFYGSSVVELKMYGPNGEIRTEERFVRIPHNLIPHRELEYSVVTGRARVRSDSRYYSQASTYYGVFSQLTAGLACELPLEREFSEKPVYAAEIIGQPTTNLTLTGSVSPGNVLTGGFNFSQPSLINLNGSFSKYCENEVRNPLKQQQRFQFAASVPLRFGNRYFGLRYFISLDRFPNFRTANMNYGFTASLAPLHINYIGRYKYSQFSVYKQSSMSSQLLLSPRVFRWFRPQLRVDYHHTENKFEKYGIYLNRRIFRTAQITLSFERNELSRTNSIMFTFNLLAGFAHVTTRALRAADRFSMNQTMRGSIRYNQTDHSFMFDRKNAVGYGTAVVRPYLDLNYNGYRDIGEEDLSGLRAKISGVSGQPRGKDRDRVYYYDRLRPYDEYLVKIDKYSLDDPTLKPTNENFRVTVNPNMVTAIDVPLVIASELTGSVKRRTEYGDIGLGGIKIYVVNLTKDILSEVTSFTDGDYYYLGLLPGAYRVYLDPAQLEKYGYMSEPESIEFEAKAVEGGVSIGDISFVLVPGP